MRKFILIALILKHPIYSNGLSLHTHTDITKIAVKEFFQCADDTMSESQNIDILRRFITNILIEENWKEDLEIEKLVKYSHYYNPFFYLNANPLGAPINRCPSNYRIHHIEHILRGYVEEEHISVSDLFWDNQCQAPNKLVQWIINPNDYFQYFYERTSLFFNGEHYNESLLYEKYLRLLGRAIHHLQDMSAPAHVVPISHVAWPDSFTIIPKDGFEDYMSRKSISDQMVSNSNSLPLQDKCDFKKSPQRTLFDILDQGARNTLQALNQEIPVKAVNPSDHKSMLINVTWKKWYDVHSALESTNGFGQYGVYQNSFGLTEFYLENDDPETLEGERGWRIYVDRKHYNHFVYQQYRQAIEATKQALQYGLGEENQTNVSHLTDLWKNSILVF